MDSAVSESLEQARESETEKERRQRKRQREREKGKQTKTELNRHYINNSGWKSKPFIAPHAVQASESLKHCISFDVAEETARTFL